MTHHAPPEDLTQYVRDKLETLRPKLLDLSRRNPLISTNFNGRTASFIRVVDELPQMLLTELTSGSSFTFEPLPPWEAQPKEEKTSDFKNALALARRTDEQYLADIERILVEDTPDSADEEHKAERGLRDRVRKTLGLAPLPEPETKQLDQHAKIHGISPSYSLPLPSDRHEDGRHTDSKIQTLLLAEDMQRLLGKIRTKCRTLQQDTGLNFMHAAFGFLEWGLEGETSYSPLLLMPVELTPHKRYDGYSYSVSSTGDIASVNETLMEKLSEHGIKLPTYVDGAVEDFLGDIAVQKPPGMTWRVHRFAMFGAFPSSQMAMYHDLDTTRSTLTVSPAVSRLLGGTANDNGGTAGYAEDYDIDVPEIENKVPILVSDADSSQFSTLVDISNGRNLAVEGPPGTGKSQTIVNAIAAALADGKKVLFVAEKTAALEVVHNRLKALGLSEFILPLQAGKSSRRDVIDSLRERVNMRPVPWTNKHYRDKLAQLHEAKASLAEYISVIGQEFDNTDFTVHEILGHALKAEPQLEEAPPEFRKTPVLLPVDFRKVHLQEIEDTAKRLEKAISGEVGEKYWAGITRGPLSRFDVDELLEKAKEAANVYTQIHQIDHKLTNEGMPPVCLLPDNVGDLLAQLRRIATLIPKTDTNMAIAILRDNVLHEFERLFDKSESARESRTRLNAIVSKLTDDVPGQLDQLHSLCETCEFDSLEPDYLTASTQSLSDSVDRGRQALGHVSQLLKQFPELGGQPVSLLTTAARIMSDVPDTALLLRHEGTTSDQILEIIKEGIARCRPLQTKREEITRTFALDVSVEGSELRELSMTFSTAGALAGMSSRFRAAKRRFLTLAVGVKKFNKAEAVPLLDGYATWKANTIEFETDQRISAAFGPAFKGVQSDLDGYENLVTWGRSISRDLSDVALREFRNFLRRADLETVASLRLLRLDGYDCSWSELEGEVSAREALLDRRRTGLPKTRALIQVLTEPANTGPNELIKLSGNVKDYLVLVNTITTNPVTHYLGDRFKGIDTTIDMFVNEQALMTELRRNSSAEAALCNNIENENVDRAIELLQTAAAHREHAMKIVEDIGERTGIPVTRFITGVDSSNQQDRLAKAAEDRSGLTRYAEAHGALIDLRKVGLSDAAQVLVQADATIREIPQKLVGLVYNVLARRAYDQHPQLRHFSGQRPDELRQRFRNTDNEIMKLSSKKLRADLFRRYVPEGIDSGPKKNWTERSLINNEVSKSRSYIAVRDLTRRAKAALLALKPCWMMSPMAVAQYLEHGVEQFDLCIIDEASQMLPEHAMGALLRAKQAVVVGDTNQLPPSQFFQSTINDSDEDDPDTDKVLNESILEMANASFRPARRLRWHYRSRHSGLISFCNDMIYDNELIVFPSPTEDRPDMGVSLVKVDGDYRAGVNMSEAEEVVAQAIRFMHADDPQQRRSLGIVTMNKQQAELIDELLTHEFARNPKAAAYRDDWEKLEDGLQSLFVKNLENVQGDERDVMLISTVYGRDTEGRMYQRFGPINGIAGRRRLNVLFSRAREQIVTVTSMVPSDIKAQSDGNPGAYMLKRWLEYSKTGRIHAGTHTGREPDSPFEEYVAQQIRSMGCEVVYQVGVAGYFIDIGVRHPSWPHGFLLGVECDGAMYHSSKSARDRDRLRQQVLEGLGWKLHRVWSTSWFTDPRSEAAKIRTAIETALAEVAGA